MDLLPKPEVILTHESDLDGLVSGLLLKRLAKSLFDTDVPLESCHYQHWKMRELREKNAWVCDFSFEPRMDKSGWVLIDHHPAQGQARNATFIHDTAKSAGQLCYELCQQHGLGSPELDRLAHLNNVADLFLEKDPHFTEANGYASLVKTYGFWPLLEIIGGRLESLLDHPLLEVMAVKHRVEDPIGYEWSRNNIVEVSAQLAFVHTLIGNVNWIIHELLEKQAAPKPVLCTLFRRPNGAMIASFRSRNGEALPIAEKFQGGGHPNACGATLPRSIKSIPDALDYLRHILNPANASPSGLNSLDQLFAGLDAKKT